MLLTLLLAMNQGFGAESPSPGELVLRECFAPMGGSSARPVVPGTAIAPIPVGGRIRGQVVDDSGLDLRGALVTLTSSALIGGAVQRVTDEGGSFAFTDLPPATYDLLVQMQGFGPVRKAGITIAEGRTTVVNIEMKFGAMAVEVVDRETAASPARTTLSKEFLSRIPSGRNYQDVVLEAQGVVGGANPNSGGAASNENTVLLDPAARRPDPTSRPGTSFDWGGRTFLSNDDSMSLASAQRLLWAVQHKLAVKASEVRPHEFLNYFHFATAPVAQGDTFSVLGSAESAGEGALTLAFAVNGFLPPRKPLDLTVVLDRSGSMNDEGRMTYLKQGLRRMQDQLRAGDRLDFVLFDDRVCTPIENFVVGRDDARLVPQLIDALHPRGSTNLDIGLREGYRIATSRNGSDRERRVLLITDALLNTGNVDPDIVSEIGRAYEDAGVRLSGVGVGSEFNDEMLDKLTEKGKGAFVFLGSEAVVDRMFGVGFDALTRTIAHDVQFALQLPPSLALARFFGEESSTVAADVQPVHYFAGNTQLFLQEVHTRGARPNDPVTLTIDYTDADTQAKRSHVYKTTVAQLLTADQRNVRKGRALMAWTDLILADALRNDPCATAWPEWQRRVDGVGDDPEIRWLAEMTGARCPNSKSPRPVSRVSLKVRLESDEPVSAVSLACGDEQEFLPITAGTSVVRFSAPSGLCTIGFDDAWGGLFHVPTVDSAIRCIRREGAVSCG